MTIMDTAAPSTLVGRPDPTGRLPTDDLSAPPPDPATPEGGTGPTSLDMVAAEQAAQEASARDAALAGTQQVSGGIPKVSGDGIGSKIVTAAEHLLGTEYSWGGNGPGGVDCSGLVAWAYKAAGINLPRISFQQADSGKRVSLSALRPGDLVAWDNSARNPGADHIAIYLGGGKIIEAAHPGTVVRIRMLSKNEGAWGVQMGWS